MGSEIEVEPQGTRHKILQIALTLMSQRGVDGTSMRDLAAAAELNVASLYHYFPSKRDLLEAVLLEHGFLPVQAREPLPDADPSARSKLATLLATILLAMFEVEDFIRLMVGETIRGEATAQTVGDELFTTFKDSIEIWIEEHRPDLAAVGAAPAMARLLSAMVVGIFIERTAGVLVKDGDDLKAVLISRANEVAALLTPVGL